MSMEQLYGELDRRESLIPTVRYKWVCRHCGYEYLGGTPLKTVYLMAGELYCGYCSPRLSWKQIRVGLAKHGIPMQKSRAC